MSSELRCSPLCQLMWHFSGDSDDTDGAADGVLSEMSPLCPLDDEHLPLVVDTLKSKQVRHPRQW